MTRPTKIGGLGIVVGEQLNGAGAIESANAGGHAKTLVRIDGDGESRAHVVLILFGHGRQAQRVGAVRRYGDTDQATSMRDHEIDQLRRDPGRGTNEVTFILAVFIVGHDDQLAGANVLDGIFYAIERHGKLLQPNAGKAQRFK